MHKRKHQTRIQRHMIWLVPLLLIVPLLGTGCNTTRIEPVGVPVTNGQKSYKQSIPKAVLEITSSTLQTEETETLHIAEKIDDAVAFMLNFQEAAGLISTEGHTFSIDAVDPILQARYAEGGNDLPLMRYLGRKGLNNIEANDLEGRIAALKASPTYDNFYGSVGKLDKALAFINRFYSNLVTVESFEEFKLDTADIVSYYESMGGIGSTFELEYATFKETSSGLDYRMTDGIAGLVITSYRIPEPAPSPEPQPQLPETTSLSPLAQPRIDVQAEANEPRFCCKVCTTGKACGNSCISKSYTCHKGSGCACDAY